MDKPITTITATCPHCGFKAPYPLHKYTGEKFLKCDACGEWFRVVYKTKTKVHIEKVWIWRKEAPR